MSNLLPAVVLSHGPGGLGTIRSLARRGVQTTVIAYFDNDPALHSRYPRTALAVHGDTDEQKEQHLLEILRNLPLSEAVIITTSDRTVTFLSAHAAELSGRFRFKLPPDDVLNALNDKRKETQLISSLGFAIPKTVRNLPDDPELLARDLRFPIIFKPHVYSVEDIFPLKNVVVGNREDLHSFYRKWSHALPVLLAQEVIPGRDDASWICSCTYDDRHKLLDCGIKQKIRALPAHFGGSTCAVSRQNPEILELARKLGHRLRYIGHAGIEFRWDARDQEYKYIELNPRIPANVCFDEASGMPTVWNSYRVSSGDLAEFSPSVQRNGVYYLDVKSDLFSMLSDGTSKLRAVAILCRLLLSKRTNGPYFAWDDPRPGLVVAGRFLKNAVKSVYRRAGFSSVNLKHGRS